jgi:hypothetical protein
MPPGSIRYTAAPSRKAVIPMPSRSAALLGSVLSLLVGAAPARPAHDERGEIVVPSAIEWRDGPASLAKGAKVAVLEGDPAKEGPFVLRIKGQTAPAPRR